MSENCLCNALAVCCNEKRANYQEEAEELADLTVIQAGPLGWKSRKGQEVDTGGHTVKGKTSEKDKS